ncbi:hypothetical protein FJZ19_03545 [Candidatus Pacearchaeota archaeon]|nr:hypothetical protein [Candidatus Pacearchaeota archaeon]
MANKIDKINEIEIECRRRIARTLLDKAKLPIMFVSGSAAYSGKVDPKVYRQYFPELEDSCMAYLVLREQHIDKGLAELMGEICLHEERREDVVKDEDYSRAVEERDYLEKLYRRLGEEAGRKSNEFKQARLKRN